MKKILLIWVLWLNFVPAFEHGKMMVTAGTSAFACGTDEDEEDYEPEDCGDGNCDDPGDELPEVIIIGHYPDEEPPVLDPDPEPPTESGGGDDVPIDSPFDEDGNCKCVIDSDPNDYSNPPATVYGDTYEQKDLLQAKCYEEFGNDCHFVFQVCGEHLICWTNVDTGEQGETHVIPGQPPGEGDNGEPGNDPFGDADGDGTPNALDPDYDNDGDGIPNGSDLDYDSDLDGIPNGLDYDNDLDGIPNFYDLDYDNDQDGIPNGQDPDHDNDNDGIPNGLDTEYDNDGDGIPNGSDPDWTWQNWDEDSNPPCSYQEYITTPKEVGHSSLDINLSSEGMMSCDFPATGGLGISDNTKYDEPVTMLAAEMKVLLDAGTIFGLRSVSDAMLNEFLGRHGNGTPSYNAPPYYDVFRSAVLTSAAENDNDFKFFSNQREAELRNQISEVNGNVGDLSSIDFGTNNLLTFTSGTNGLGILIHTVTDVKMHLTSFVYCAENKQYRAKIKYTLIDDFGLDHNDVVSFPYSSFKAWYVLQHFRCFQPYLTEFVIERTFYGKIE